MFTYNLVRGQYSVPVFRHLDGFIWGLPTVVPNDWLLGTAQATDFNTNLVSVWSVLKWPEQYLVASHLEQQW